MNLFGFNITRRSAPTETPVSQLSPQALAWLQGNDAPYTGPTLTSAYEQVVWVYRAINVIAEQVANIPFLFSAGERGRENLITSGPLLDFYARPHPHINRFEYWELRVIWLMLRGECMRIPIYENATAASPSPGGEGRGEGERFSSAHSPSLAAPKSDEGGSPLSTHGTHGTHGTHNSPATRHPSPATRHLKSVLILDPSRFQHIVQDNQLMGWRYTGLGPQAPLEAQVFLPEEVWFDKLPNPFDFWRGLPPLAVADLAAKTDFAAASFMRGFLENNADNGLIVRTDEQLDDEQRAQIYAALRNRKRRAGCADTPLLLWSSAEVVKPELSSADLQFLENRKFSRGEICAAFGVPEEIVATTDHNKYDVMQGARLNFIENRVAPLCARLEAEENATTIPALSRRSGAQADSASGPVTRHSSPVTPTGWFDLDSLPIMQEARRARVVAAKTGFDMGIPFNELNRVFDLGFKPLPWGDTGYLPSKYQPLCNPTLPAAPKPGEGGPAAPKPGQGGPALPKPGEGGPALPKPSEAGPAAPKPSEAGPAAPKPGEGGPPNDTAVTGKSVTATLPAPAPLALARELRDVLKNH